jgi:hypothetical protein
MMRLVVVLAVVLGATPASAEIDKLGGMKLGDKVKPRATPATLYGCAGTIAPDVDGARRVVRVRFRTKRCSPDALARAISREARTKPVANAIGDQLWEGARSSVIISTSLATKASPVILLVPAVRGARACWPNDGFATWWSGFTTALGAGKPEALAASFAFPVKDAQGAVKIARPADLAEAWAQVDPEDVQQLRSGALAPTCSVDDQRYELSLGDSYIKLTATRVQGAWRWTVFAPYSPG